MLSIPDLSALPMSDRMAEYRRARDQNRSVSGGYKTGRGSVFHHTISPPPSQPISYPEGAYQSVTAIMAGIWDDSIQRGGKVLMTSDAALQRVVDDAVAARLRELTTTSN
jgi:hypothetical protein